MLQRRDANTRWRDFADGYILSLSRPMDGEQLHASLATVARHRHRQADITSLSNALRGMPEIAQPKWAARRRKQRMEQRLPEPFTDVAQQAIAFGDPVTRGSGDGMTWEPRMPRLDNHRRCARSSVRRAISSSVAPGSRWISALA